jgi:hypothetical protein
MDGSSLTVGLPRFVTEWRVERERLVSRRAGVQQVGGLLGVSACIDSWEWTNRKAVDRRTGPLL